MENASANADPDAHVPQLASGGEDGIFGTSGTDQYRTVQILSSHAWQKSAGWIDDIFTQF